MANELTNTELAAVIPEVWRPQILEARYAKMTVGKRVLGVESDLISKMGDIVHLPVMPGLSANTVTAATGGVTNQSVTLTDNSLTINSWKESTVDIVDRAIAQSYGDMAAQFRKSFGGAMAVDTEDALLALHSSVTTNVVGATSAPFDTINPDMIHAAVEKLLSLDIPVDDPNDVSFIFHTTVWRYLKNIDVYNNANLTGKSVGGQLEQKVPDLAGIPVFFTSRVVSSGGVRKNLLLHRECLAWALQKNFNFEVLARTRKSTPYSADWLYGVAAIRENHGCVLNTAA